jgi:D-alanyl-D-alanine carboxypeptidase/D-alanyl-D-alanine-endopeptidase (penicillin-binding protein 4)
MLRRFVCLISLVGFLYWPSPADEATSFLASLRQPEWIDTAAVRDYLDLLKRRGVDLADQGVRVESLDGGLIYADHQSDQTFNPASVIKVATTLAALERFGSEHRFETAFYVDGVIEDGTLTGDLILASDGDPVMATADLTRLARDVINAGIRKVDGLIVISGPFTIGNLHRRNQVAPYLTRTLRRIGIRVPDEVIYGQARGTQIASRESSALLDIVFDQNARSDNVTADRLGEAIGGRRALERYLIDEVGIPESEIRVSRASGLRVNRITPEGMVMVLRKMARWVNDRGMYPEDILPVAGLDQGTTRLRFNNREYRGAVVAKTGTLVSTDDGVSTLAGILYTEDHGPLLFAIFNTHGPVIQYRRFQDEFIKDLLDEYGGRAESNAQTHRAAS